MTRGAAAVLLALASGCLESPPGSRPGDGGGIGEGDGAPPACAGLDLLVESFDEDDAEDRFLNTWEPGTATWDVVGGDLTLTSSRCGTGPTARRASSCRRPRSICPPRPTCS